MKRLLLILVLPAMISLHMSALSDDNPARATEDADKNADSSAANPGFSNMSTNVDSFARAETDIKSVETKWDWGQPDVDREG